jgi:hypothetical protein
MKQDTNPSEIDLIGKKHKNASLNEKSDLPKETNNK